jgi:hypothetical protein
MQGRAGEGLFELAESMMASPRPNPHLLHVDEGANAAQLKFDANQEGNYLSAIKRFRLNMTAESPRFQRAFAQSNLLSRVSISVRGDAWL